MTQLVYLNVLISLYEFNIWLDGYIWWKFCVNSPLRNPLTDKNADVSNTYFPRCIYELAVEFCIFESSIIIKKKTLAGRIHYPALFRDLTIYRLSSAVLTIFVNLKLN